MNSLTLKFKTEQIEELYKQHIYKTQNIIFYRNMIASMVLVFIAALYNFGFGFYVEAGFCLFLVIYSVAMIYICKTMNKYFDLLCLVCQLSLNLLYITVSVLGLRSGGLSDYNFYETGVAMAYFSFRQIFFHLHHFSFNLGSNFLLKFLPIFLNVLGLLIHYGMLNQRFSVFNLTLILGGVMTATSTYFIDKVRRQAFQSEINEKIWQENLDSSIDILIVQ